MLRARSARRRSPRCSRAAPPGEPRRRAHRRRTLLEARSRPLLEALAQRGHVVVEPALWHGEARGRLRRRGRRSTHGTAVARLDDAALGNTQAPLLWSPRSARRSSRTSMPTAASRTTTSEAAARGLLPAGAGDGAELDRPWPAFSLAATPSASALTLVQGPSRSSDSASRKSGQALGPDHRVHGERRRQHEHDRKTTAPAAPAARRPSASRFMPRKPVVTVPIRPRIVTTVSRTTVLARRRRLSASR